MITFAELLSAGRNAAGMTQAELSKASGVHRVYIAQLETGKRADPSYSMLRKLCAALGPQFVKAIKADLESSIVSMKKSRKKSL